MATDIKIINAVVELIQQELEKANIKFSPFASAHEGYAVILEEVDEMKEELESLECYMTELWGAVKQNLPKRQHHDTDQIIHIAKRIIFESLQVAAMARKFQQYLESEQNKATRIKNKLRE